MKNKPNSKKLSLIIGGSVVLLVLAYFYFSSSNPPQNSDSLLQADGTDSTTVGMRTLSLLNQIKSLRIDTAIFTDKAYLSLQDYSVIIPEIPVGRPNPFAPIPGQPVPSSGTTGR